MTTTAHSEATTSIDATVSENVNTLLFRSGMSARAMGRALGMSSATLSRKMTGGGGWGLAEVVAIAEHFCVSLEEMTSALPTREEWEGRWAVRHQGLEPRTR